ncbi:MAG TPA: hypothetical protein VFE77_05410 [Rhodanobacter sp.]|nr:hypothetical protein [Rhodanobacter sp.]
MHRVGSDGQQVGAVLRDCIARNGTPSLDPLAMCLLQRLPSDGRSAGNQMLKSLPGDALGRMPGGAEFAAARDRLLSALGPKRNHVRRGQRPAPNVAAISSRKPKLIRAIDASVT